MFLLVGFRLFGFTELFPIVVAALPFLRDAVYFLYPCGLVLVAYLISLLFALNCTTFALGFYFG